MTKSEFVLMLLRGGLWQQPVDHFSMAPWQYKAVLDEADKQCIFGLVSDCLKSNDIKLEKKCVIHMLKYQNTLSKVNSELDHLVAELAQLLNANGIRYAIVKGQSIGVFYPKPPLRVPGDIDFYVDKKDISKTVSVLNENWKLDLDPKRFGLKHQSFEYKNFDFEMHKNLLALTTRSNLRLFNKWVEESELVDISVGGYDHVKTLEPTVNIFYTFCHLFHHLRIEGVAFRQLCDWAILMHHYQKQIDKDRLVYMLKKTDYYKPYAAFGSVIIDKLGFPKELFPLPITEKDKKWADVIYKDIITGGNWGEYDSNIGDKHIMKEKIKFWWSGISRFFKYFWLSPRELSIFITCTMPLLFIDWIKRRFR